MESIDERFEYEVIKDQEHHLMNCYIEVLPVKSFAITNFDMRYALMISVPGFLNQRKLCHLKLSSLIQLNSEFRMYSYCSEEIDEHII